MTADHIANWMFAEGFLPETPAVRRARARAAELGVAAPSAGACSLITVLTAAVQVHSAVEIGTGAGVAALAILAGMPDGGVLTSIDAESEHQRSARDAFAEAEIPPAATRLINSRPAQVLPRLADGAYDLVLFTAYGADGATHLADALRILRPGGILVIDGAFAGGRVPDPARRDPVTVAVRVLTRTIRDLEGHVVALVPAGDGVLIAVRD